MQVLGKYEIRDAKPNETKLMGLTKILMDGEKVLQGVNADEKSKLESIGFKFVEPMPGYSVWGQ